MAFLSFPVVSVKEIQDLARKHADERGFPVCFTGEIEKLSEAKGMERLLVKMAEESHWKISLDGLPGLAVIDDALGHMNWLLVRILEIDSMTDFGIGFPTTDLPSSTRRVDRAAISTDMTSPDYGTVEFSRRLGMEFLRGRPAGRPDCGSTEPGGRSVSIGHRHVESTRGRGRSADSLRFDASSGRRATAERLLTNSSSGRSGERLLFDTSPGTTAQGVDEPVS